MIVFDLRCGNEHVFEAWFASSGVFDAQRRGLQIHCPVCGDTDVGKAVMAPNIAAKGNAASAPPPPAVIKSVMARIAEAQAKVLEQSSWVGGRFAAEARAMHAGEVAPAPIHGEATPTEARALIDDGVPIAPLLLPVVPPKALN